ncbi:hypothetical protein [Bordetella sp. FB-8]|uniref:hypothetical protein n=1 Tax=Bordetella sp. FB-8 TaxID=1159870 RepID=UPI00039AFEBC|nr:hypothetical protein [Bordetella sp. FB-8]
MHFFRRCATVSAHESCAAAQARTRPGAAADLARPLVDDVHAYAGKAGQFGDITLAVIRHL